MGLFRQRLGTDGTVIAMGFDFGMRFIGVAVAECQTQATHLCRTIRRHKGQPDWHSMEQQIAQWRPQILVVGLPLLLNGRHGAMAKRARRFGAALTERFHIEHEMWDERLSTQVAKADWSGSDPDELHQRAAEVILNGWLWARRRQ